MTVDPLSRRIHRAYPAPSDLQYHCASAVKRHEADLPEEYTGSILVGTTASIVMRSAEVAAALAEAVAHHEHEHHHHDAATADADAAAAAAASSSVSSSDDEDADADAAAAAMAMAMAMKQSRPGPIMKLMSRRWSTGIVRDNSSRLTGDAAASASASSASTREEVMYRTAALARLAGTPDDMRRPGVDKVFRQGMYIKKKLSCE